MLLAWSNVKSHTCSAIIVRVRTDPARRMKYSSSAYSRAVTGTARPLRVTVRADGSSTSGPTASVTPGPPFDRRRCSARSRAVSSTIANGFTR